MLIQDRIKREAVKLAGALEKIPHTAAHEYNLEGFLNGQQFMRFAFMLKTEKRGHIPVLIEDILSGTKGDITGAVVRVGREYFPEHNKKGGLISELYVRIEPNQALQRQAQLESMERELKKVKEIVDNYLYKVHNIR